MKKEKTLAPDPSKLSGRIWFNLCLFGLVGQIAWNLENMYYNTFMYNTVYEGGTVTGTLSSMTAIRLMVALSAITAVVPSTFDNSSKTPTSGSDSPFSHLETA